VLAICDIARGIDHVWLLILPSGIFLCYFEFRYMIQRVWVMPRGGARKNAGRPIGQGPYGEATCVIRVPRSRASEIKAQMSKPTYRIPLFSCQVPAGFPSPADDHIEDRIDLNQHLIAHPAATFMVKAVGDSMCEAGIFSGDFLLIDRSVDPVHGKIVIAAVDGALTVKRLCITQDKMILKAENKDYPDIEVKLSDQAVIWGVVISVIRQV
jgi:DNA polymerase V